MTGKDRNCIAHHGVRRTRRGQATVEFALTMTVLLLFLYGIIEVSRLVFINSEIENAAREGARVASYRYINNTQLRDVVVGRLTLADKTAITVTGPDYPGSPGRCVFCEVQVTVDYQWRTLVPFLHFGPINLHSSATKLVESPGN
jgi:hypothetical protein